MKLRSSLVISLALLVGLSGWAVASNSGWSALAAKSKLTTQRGLFPAPSPDQNGCYYKQVQCIQAPCDPILICPTPSPTATPSADLTYTVDTAVKTDISPYIYGTNELGYQHSKLIRAGGNRWTGYNWENNASNAGTDWNNSSDNYLCDISGGYHCTIPTTPGEAVKGRILSARATGAASLITVPIVDYVAADKNGNVTSPATPTNPRWATNGVRKPAWETSVMGDRKVYQDEFVTFIETTFPTAHYSSPSAEVFYALDNEPALWPTTHPLIHGAKPTYAEMGQRTASTAAMIKAMAPSAKVFGSVAYGYSEFQTLQDAPDKDTTQAVGQVGNSYIDYLLAETRNRGQAQSRRLMDVLDLHWYPEAQDPATGCRIIDCASDTDSKIQARVQAPRSLWDPTYTEQSWITQWVTMGPIRLIPDMRQRIANNYPGTALALSEYNYGGGSHISGAIAHADVLGIAGREGLFAANLWEIDNNNNFTYAAFDMYLNYDLAGSKVGSKSLKVTGGNAAHASVYSMADPSDPNKLHLVAINKTNAAKTVLVSLQNTSGFTTAQSYQLTGASSTPTPAGSIPVSNNQVYYSMPAYSITTLVLRK